jgi:hypothetical protein
VYFYRFYFEVFLHFRGFSPFFYYFHPPAPGYKQVTSYNLQLYWVPLSKFVQQKSVHFYFHWLWPRLMGGAPCSGLNVAHSEEIGASQPNTRSTLQKK